MDPTHHDKIVDKLLQYWGRMPSPWHTKNNSSRKAIYLTQMRINDLIREIENLSNCMALEDLE